MNWLRDTLNNKGARAKCLKWAYFALATSLHVLANVSIYCAQYNSIVQTQYSGLNNSDLNF